MIYGLDQALILLIYQIPHVPIKLCYLLVLLHDLLFQVFIQSGDPLVLRSVLTSQCLSSLLQSFGHILAFLIVCILNGR